MSNEAANVSTSGSRSRIILTAAFLIGVPVIALLLYISLAPAKPTAPNNAAAIIEGTPYDGSTIIDPPRELQDFTLSAHTGDRLRLSDLRGQMVLIYFGYTHCPDYCPAMLLTFQRIHELLGDRAAGVTFLFISVDSRRDTPRVIADYLESRGVADFVTGLAGDEETLRQIALDYGLYYAIQPGAELQENYPVDHTTAVYLVDLEGRLVTIYDFGTEADVIADDIAGMLAE